jgi:hypothetical protein
VITLIGSSTIVMPNPSVENLETVDTGVALNASRRGVLSGAITAPVIKRRRFDFKTLTVTEKETLLNFLINHIGVSVTVQWSRGECTTDVLNEAYLVDDQPLEIINVRPNCTYDCSTYWIKI